MGFYLSIISAQLTFVRERSQGERDTEQTFRKITREAVLTSRNGSLGWPKEQRRWTRMVPVTVVLSRWTNISVNLNYLLKCVHA